MKPKNKNTYMSARTRMIISEPGERKETEKFEEVHKEHKRKKFATEGLEKARREKRV